MRAAIHTYLAGDSTMFCYDESAGEWGVLLIDLAEKSRELLCEMGPRDSKTSITRNLLVQYRILINHKYFRRSVKI
jgi:hypothetical protein